MKSGRAEGPVRMSPLDAPHLAEGWCCYLLLRRAPPVGLSFSNDAALDANFCVVLLTAQTLVLGIELEYPSPK
jgi:hypothetical protein